MKYINNGISHNTIKDSDINLSESFQNQNLAEVLTLYKEDLNTLKSNVKWLAKYGGVGGSGGSGGSSTSNVKLKYKVDIDYINNADKTDTLSYGSNTKSNRLLVKSGTYATVTITLQKCLPNVPYNVRISYGEQVYTKLVDSLTLSVQQNVLCLGNSNLNVIVYATPDDMPETSVKIITEAKEISLDLKTDQDIIISDGSVLLQSYVNKTTLTGTIVNYIPDSYSGQFKTVKINNLEIEFESYTLEGEFEITTFKIPASDIFSGYGIYEVQMTYEYNYTEEVVKRVYVYKDDPAFIYCYGETNSVYANEVTNPNTSNFTVETVKFRIYPETGKASNENYTVEHTIEYEGKPEKTLTTSDYYESNCNFSLQFPNVYSKTDFSDTDLFKKVTITFRIGTVIYTYYVYIRLLDELSYIFTTLKGELFYNADHSCTATLNDDPNPNTTFPFVNGQFKTLLSDELHYINRLADKTSLTSAYSVYGEMTQSGLSGGYVTNHNAESGATDADVLISFGLKYDEFNLDLPIVTIQVNNAHSITLYSNKIAYGVNSEYSRWCIPKDGQYHLVLLYYKPRYSVSGSECTSGPPLGTSTFIWCIDGVFETQPININPAVNLVPFAVNESSITYHPGNWDFNFIGLASFNAKPIQSLWANYASKLNPEVLRYALDFDPIITANYYQAYTQFNKTELKHIFDLGIYPKLYSSLEGNKHGVNFYKNEHKFIPTDIISLGKLTNLPMYIIEPIATTEDKTMNMFLYNTYKGGYNETSDTPVSDCYFKKLVIQGDSLQEEHLVSDTKYLFEVTYQGSSTLKYGVKNFEIGAKPHTDLGGVQHTIVWTPDINVFLPESSFTLKADVVDSSHSNNVIVGKFVNQYMKEFALGKNCKTCLEGFPILLFMKDTTTDNSTGANNIFLGIYSFNLGRKSVYNLGYKTLNVNNCDDISGSGNSKTYLLNADAITYSNKYRVAEVQDNSPVLFDYSLYDLAMLENKMLGDYFNYDGISETTRFNPDFLRPFIGLNKLIYSNFINNILQNYDSYNFTSNSELVGYYRPKIGKKIGLFNVLQLNFNYSEKLEILPGFYYKKSMNVTQKVPDGSLVLSSDQIKTIKPYLTMGDNNLAVIGNPFYQFHLICSEDGVPDKNGFYYVEELNNILSFDNQNDDYFNYDAILKYYIVCMLFAMVDSVQKNLTIRCKDFDLDRSNEWLVGFYDMDTSFGVDNFGNPVDFKAFSDYILDSGKIVTDFYAEDSETKEGSGFDLPSSYLFLAAKYLNILSVANSDTPLGERTYVNESLSTILKTPFNYWQSLRGPKGILESVDKFFETYVDNHFSSVNPLIWNLNYMYKYFSISGTQGGEDTEQSKFNGTRRFSRKNWLEQRLGIIDVLFGIRNNHSVGNSDSSYICKQKAEDDTLALLSYSGFLTGNNISIAQTMFPSFKKGVTGEFRVNATSYPKTPIVFQQSTNDYTLYLADNAGKFKLIVGDITSSVDCGFFGTTQLKTLSDCGYFLRNTSENEINTIKNNNINTIVINKFPNNGALNISLDLANIQSTRIIKVNENLNTTYKGKSFSIVTNNDFTLDEVVLSNATFSSTLSLVGNNSSKLIIKKLTIKGCSAEVLQLKGIKVETLTLLNCLFKKYDIQGEIPDISITDGNALDISIIVMNKDINVSINTPALTKLNLQGSIKSFNNTSAASKCTDITVKGITPQQVTLYLRYFPGYAKELKVELESSVKLLYFAGNNNNACLGYNFVGTGIEKVRLLDSAFMSNGNITYINLNNNSLIQLVPVELTGNYIFYNCGKLPVAYCIPNGSKSFKLIGTSYTQMYQSIAAITINDVINFFNYTELTQNSVSLQYLFYGCNNVEFKLNGSDDSSFTKPAVYDTFVNTLSKFISGKTINFLHLFADTKFNFLDQLLIRLFKNGNNLPLICSKIFTSGETTIVYITEDALMGNNLINVDLTGGSGYLGSVKVVKADGSNYTLVRDVNVYNLLNNGTLKTVTAMRLYSSSSIQIDCTDSLPNTITTFKHFTLTNYSNVKNIENIFNNLSENCSVYIDLFLFAFSVDRLKFNSDVNIFNLFFKDNGTPKVTLKLTNLTTFSNTNNANTAKIWDYDDDRYPLNFNKTCTKNQFKKIMDYLYNLQTNYLSTGNAPSCSLYNLIPGLFLNCLITGVGTFKELITAPDELTYFTVRRLNNREVNYLDLLGTFINCTLLNNVNETVAFDSNIMWDEVYTEDEELYKTKVLTLENTFKGTLLEKIINVFPIRWVKSMRRTFYNCLFKPAPNSEDTVVNGDPSGSLGFSYVWQWKNNYPLLPPLFFTGFNACDISECFANTSKSKDNILGQLPMIKDNLWWTSGADVKLDTIASLFTNALLHPIPLEENVDGNIVTNYYIYPKAYTDAFKTNTGIYEHVILPLSSNGDDGPTLFLFLDSDTLLNFIPKLPCLPSISTHDYEGTLRKKTWKIRINKKDTLNNNTNLMGNAQYKNLIPASLFLVLSSFNFKTYNIVNSKPIVFSEGYAYNWGIWPSRSTTPTPGGINFEDLNTTLQNVLLS